MRHTFAVYGRSISAHLRSIVEYPADFWVMASAGGIHLTVQFAFITVLFANITAIAGWGYHEMLLLNGFLSIGVAATAVFWDGIWNLPSQIVNGEMDYKLTRPAPAIIQIAASHVGMQSFGQLTLGIAMLIYGWVGAGIGWTLIPVAVFLLACAIVIEISVFTILCCINFWVKGHQPVFTFLAMSVQQETMRFPITIYPRAVQVALTYVLPFALVSFIPAQILTGRASYWWLAAPPLVAALLVGLSVLVGRAGLRAYDSAGH